MDALPFLSLCLPRDNGVECPSPASDSTPRYIPGIDLTGTADALNYDTWYPARNWNRIRLFSLFFPSSIKRLTRYDRRTILNELFQLIYIRITIQLRVFETLALYFVSRIKLWRIVKCK